MEGERRFIETTFRLHGGKGDETRKFTKAAKSSSILITEGTRVRREEQGNFQNRKFMKML